MVDKPVILVVGGAGYIGSHMVLDLLRADYPVVNLDNLSRGHRDLLALEALLEGGGNSTYNLGNSTGYSVRQVIEVARTITGHPIPADIAPRRAGDPAILVADSSRIRARLGWQPAYENIDAIIRTAWAWHQREAG